MRPHPCFPLTLLSASFDPTHGQHEAPGSSPRQETGCPPLVNVAPSSSHDYPLSIASFTNGFWLLFKMQQFGLLLALIAE